MTQDSFPSRAYFVCCDARTGSSLLVGVLRRTLVAGSPYEYFSAQEIDQPWMRNILQISAQERFRDHRAWRDAILRAGANPGGIFGASLHWFQLPNAISTFRSDPAAHDAIDERPIETLRAFFPDLRLIRLSRQNVVAQAVSHYTAIKSGEWMRRVNRAKELRAPTFEELRRRVPYDFAEIDWQVRSAQVAQEGWSKVLAGHEAITIALTYEEIDGDLPSATQKVLAHIGADLGDRPTPAPILERQATPWARELERLYRFERRARQLGSVGDEAALARSA